MGVGSLGGIAFTIDPSSVAYHFDVKSSTTNTVGGKVVQVYGFRAYFRSAELHIRQLPTTTVS